MTTKDAVKSFLKHSILGLTILATVIFLVLSVFYLFGCILPGQYDQGIPSILILGIGRMILIAFALFVGNTVYSVLKEILGKYTIEIKKRGESSDVL